MERPDLLDARVTLEVLERHVCDDEALIRPERPARSEEPAVPLLIRHEFAACENSNRTFLSKVAGALECQLYATDFKMLKVPTSE